MTAFHVMIPARLASTRLPDKVLADLGGRPMIVRVLERARSAGAESVCVTTDSEAVAAVVRAAGAEAVMTDPAHTSGTSRLAEALVRRGLAPDAIVVNVQGDEPALPPACIRQVAELLAASPDARMATLWAPCTREQWSDPNVVKLVADRAGRALYFSRAPVPARRAGDWPAELARRHIGLYAYRAAALAEWPGLAPSGLEQSESLEQLRALEAGWTLACARAVEPVPPGVDTADDLAGMRRLFAADSADGADRPGRRILERP